MTGPTDAGQLLALAAEELHQLSQRTSGNVPAQLAAAWPVFLRNGEHLASALNPLSAPVASLWPERQPGRPAPPLLAAAPDRHLQRAADLLGAAGDLISTRSRTHLLPHDAAADNAQAARCLLSGAVQVAQALGPLPDWARTAVDAAVAARTWGRDLPRAGAGGGSGSLRDARTAPTTPGALSNEVSTRLTGAIEQWRQAALGMILASAPDSRDLRDCGRTAGQLLALSQVLLRSYAAEAGSVHAVEHSYMQIRTAGRSWNAMIDSWGTIATGCPRDLALLELTDGLHEAIGVAGRAVGPNTAWAGVPAIRARMAGSDALTSAHLALNAVQDVAEAHAPLVENLANAGKLYAPARRLEATTERLGDRLKGRWVPVPPQECAALTDGYEHLVVVSAAARLTFVRLTESPPRNLTPGTMPGQDKHLAHAATEPKPAPVSTLATQRWDQTLLTVDPRLADDPHYPALAAALDRIELSRQDVARALEAASKKPLPAEHAARELHYRLIEVCPEALHPSTVAPGPARPRAQTGVITPVGRPQPAPAAPRR